MPIFSHTRIIAALITSFSISLAIPAMAQDISVNDAYARTTGTSNATGAAFMTILNSGDEDDRLIAVFAEISRKAELHTHKETGDGIMQMREIEGGIEVTAGGMAMLKRGGDHVMLMGLSTVPADGETFVLTLTFEKAGDVTVMIVVDQHRKPGAASHSHNTADN